MTKRNWQPPPPRRLGAVVLSRAYKGEADLVLTFLTREMGLVPAIAKNARYSRRRFGGGLLNLGRAAWYDFTFKAGYEVAFVENAEANPKAPVIPENPVVQALVAWALELVKIFEAQRNPAEASFNILVRHLGKLSGLDDFRPPSLPARKYSLSFTKCYLELAGFGLNFSTCANCEKQPAEGETWFWEPKGAGVFCPNCQKLAPGSHKVPGGLLKALNLIENQATCLDIPENWLSLAENLLEETAAIQADHGFRSRWVLKRLLNKQNFENENNEEAGQTDAP